MAIDRPPTAALGEEGVVTPSFDRGALLLENEEGDVFRLSWEREHADTPKDRRRALPAGAYELVSYRILMRDGEDDWHVSATGHSIQRVSVLAGEELRIEVDPRIRIAKRVRPGQITIAVRGDHRAGLSIYKDGKRIPIGYRITEADGDEVASGDFEYG